MPLDFVRAYKILKEGEVWKRFSVCFSPKDYDDMNHFRGDNSKSEFMRRLLNMYRKAIGAEITKNTKYVPQAGSDAVEKRERKEVENEIKVQVKEKITVDTF